MNAKLKAKLALSNPKKIRAYDGGGILGLMTL
jgi:hypothetical protein